MRESCARRLTQCEADDTQVLHEPQGTPGIGANDVGEALGEHASPATSLGAEEFAHMQVPAYPVSTPWHIGQPPLIAAVDASRPHVTEGTSARASDRGHRQGHLCVSIIDNRRVKLETVSDE